MNADQPADPPIFFFHAGGLPLEGIADLLDSADCLGRPRDLFDLEGTMWTLARNGADAGFASYLERQIQEARAEDRRFSAMIDWRDLLWLERRSAFQDLMRRPFRAVRLACLDPVLQARRRLLLDQHQAMEPDFATLSRELVAIEQDEDIGEAFAAKHGVHLPRLWVEDLARPGAPTLLSLLDRWSLTGPRATPLRPIQPPTDEELEAVAAFRAEARKRHWAHALKPRTA